MTYEEALNGAKYWCALKGKIGKALENHDESFLLKYVAPINLKSRACVDAILENWHKDVKPVIDMPTTTVDANVEETVMAPEVVTSTEEITSETIINEPVTTEMTTEPSAEVKATKKTKKAKQTE